MARRILLVEDDLSLRETLKDALELEGHDVTAVGDGVSGTETALSRHFALLILDLMLPGRGGLEILRDVRAAGLTVPVLLLTVRGDENDKVLGFELGADDYVTKPFSLRELLARVQALVRRGSGAALAEPAVPARFTLGEVEIDLEIYELRRDGESVSLSPKEAGILRLLYAEHGKVVSRSRFLEELWGEDAAVTDRTIDTHVLNLRQKIERDARSPRYIVTVHGVGYRLALTSS